MNASLIVLSGLVAAATGSSLPAAATDAAPPFGEMLRIDAHSHVFEDMPVFNAMLQRTHARTVNICVPGTDGRLGEMHALAVALDRKYPGLYPFVTTFDLRPWQEPGFAEVTARWLRRAFDDGAVGVKIWKEVGMELKRPDGSYLMPDDPLFDPIYAFIAAQNRPLVAHLAEPIDAWRPLDPNSAHYQYYADHPEWHLYGKTGFPAHATIIAARDHLLQKHPDLVVIGAHLGSLEHDLEALSARLDRYPNFNVDCAARIRDLVRHPSDQVRAFLIRYQDRVLYGVDMGWTPHRGGTVTEAQRESYVRRMEARQRNDYEYLAGTGEVKYLDRNVPALQLPRSVLEKLYHENATRLFHLGARTPAPAP